MRALLICPYPGRELAALTQDEPLTHIPILGRSLLGLWLEHLALLGAREVLVLAADRWARVRDLVGDGARWGLRAEVIPESRPFTASEAYLKYRRDSTEAWLPRPHDITVLDHLPNLPDLPLLGSYGDLVEAVLTLLRDEALHSRIGVRELKPGVLVGLRTQCDPSATLVPPCWIGEDVRIPANAVIGPGTVIEDRTMVGFGSQISHSLIGPDTYVGALTEVKDSIARGSLMINWRTGSWTDVPDAFLLSALGRSHAARNGTGWGDRLLAAGLMLSTLPFAAVVMLKSKWRREPVFRSFLAVRPQPHSHPFRKTIVYYELTGSRGRLRRWPQLWNIVLGDFAWLGHRPLSPADAARLTDGFERLQLAAPLGLISVDEDDDLPGVRAASRKNQSGDGSIPGDFQVEVHGRALRVSGLREIDAATSRPLLDACAKTIDPDHNRIEVDLGQVVFVDSCGLGALLYLDQIARRSGGGVCLKQANSAVRQILELTRIGQTLEIVFSEERRSQGNPVSASAGHVNGAQRPARGLRPPPVLKGRLAP